jgi:adenylate cyclase
MARQTTFEVYSQQGGRWEIHSRFPASRKDAAVQEAKILENQQSVSATKVVREVYDADEGTSEESTIYKSPTLKEKKERKQSSGGGGRRSSGGGGGGGRDGGGDNERGSRRVSTGTSEKVEAARPGAQAAQAPKKSSLVSVLVKILLVALISFFIAGMVAYAIEALLPHGRVFGVSMVGQSRASIVLAIFVIAFLFTAIPLAIKFLSKVKIKVPTSVVKAGARAVAKGKSKAASNKTEKKKKARFIPSPSGKRGKDDDDEEDDTSFKMPSADEDEEKAAKEEEKEEAPPEEEDTDEETVLSKDAEKSKVVMMRFLGKALEHVKKDKKTMDNFHKFGAALFLAGANESLCQQQNIDPDMSSRILGDNVRVLGFKKSQADGFSDKCDEYLLADTRYMEMYQAGRNAMTTYLDGNEAEGSKGLHDALDDWNKPKGKEEKSKLLTVMFTDMVGSTSLTQIKGDAVAQQVVRAHNRIVREALTLYAGKEIKHTGDGIMASFNSAADSVEASVFIQEKTLQHTSSNPELPLHLKIGLNAGEPIAEEDDLFGTTVQLAARIVDKAQSEQIFVSEIIRGICAGKSTQFLNAGDHAMKGVTEPVTLYEVAWSGSPTVSGGAAPEPPAPAAEAAPAAPAPEPQPVAVEAAPAPQAEPTPEAAPEAVPQPAAAQPAAQPAAAQAAPQQAPAAAAQAAAAAPGQAPQMTNPQGAS